MQPVKVGQLVRTYSAVIERCSETGLLVSHVPGSAPLLEDGEPNLESDVVGLQQIVVPV